MTLVKINNRPAKHFDNLFEELFNGFPANWGGQVKTSVPVNIHETKDGYHLEFSAPGRTKEDFKVEVDKGLLNISFESKENKENSEGESQYKTIRREFNANSFKRSFTVDEKIDADNIQARYENGVLKVYVPKKEEIVQAGRQINVQ